MAKRRQLILVLAGVFFSLGATYRTPNGNFLVEAPTSQIAQQVGQWAEYYRKEKAIQWYRLAAASGEAAGAHSRGWMHQTGLGEERDYKRALKCYRCRTGCSPLCQREPVPAGRVRRT